MSILTLAAALTGAAQTPDPAPLAPAGQWKVDHAAANCALSRDFGTGEQRRTLALVGDWIDQRATLLVIDQRPALGTSQAGKVRLALGTEADDTEAHDVPNIALSRRMLSIRVEGPILAAIPATRQLAITPISGAALSAPVVFATGQMDKAWQAFRACQHDLAKAIGLDAASLAKVVIRAKVLGNPAEYFGPNAYPAEAKSRRISGRVEMRLAIDSAGTVMGCHVERASPLPSLDAATCAIVRQRIRFTPAQTADGTPTASDYALKVNWRLGDPL